MVAGWDVRLFIGTEQIFLVDAPDVMVVVPTVPVGPNEGVPLDDDPKLVPVDPSPHPAASARTSEHLTTGNLMMSSRGKCAKRPAAAERT